MVMHHQLSLSVQVAMVQRGELSARALVETHLSRLHMQNPTLHASLALCENALRLADSLDQARAKGQHLGPLAGATLAIKDNIVSSDSRTTAGSKALANFRSPYEATVLTKLKAAGAIPLLKANLDEFGMGNDTRHSAFGSTANPWDRAYVPGGSSGGSAACVAAGLSAGALGSDTGGSIRQPAAFCGVVGLKPTYGRVSRWGLVAYASSLEQIGPMARTVEDTRLLFESMIGHDPRDATSLSSPSLPHLMEEPPARRRVGILTHLEGLEPAIQDHFSKVLKVLESQGVELVPIHLPHLNYALSAYALIASAEASSNLARYDGVRFGHRTDMPTDIHDLYARSRAEAFGSEVKRRLLLGTLALSASHYAAYYERALKVRALLEADVAAAFAKCELLLTPVSPCLPWSLEASAEDLLEQHRKDILTIPANLLGLPALSVPAGVVSDAKGAMLPVGLQVMGPALSESRLFSWGQWFEHLFPTPPCPRMEHL